MISRFPAIACLLILLFFRASAAQPKIAVLVPEKNGQSERFAGKIESSLVSKFKIFDASLGETAFRSVEIEKPFNLTIAESKLIGAAIGCDFFVLVKSENQRRYSFAKKDHIESFAAIYLVSSRTGRLVFWKLASQDDAREEGAEKKLFDAAPDLAAEIASKIQIAAQNELNEKNPPQLSEIPPENSPEAKNFRPPLPYKRMRPAFTELARLYKIDATVDIEVDFDENGQILRSEIVRWAGFGLDEAVEQTVRRMNWRAAERDGKKLPVRALLRYNFRKIEKEE